MYESESGDLCGEYLGDTGCRDDSCWSITDVGVTVGVACAEVGVARGVRGAMEQSRLLLCARLRVSDLLFSLSGSEVSEASLAAREGSVLR